MSKISSKQRYEQLMSWLSWRDSHSKKSQGKPKFSKADHYKKVNQHHGNKEGY